MWRKIVGQAALFLLSIAAAKIRKHSYEKEIVIRSRRFCLRLCFSGADCYQ